MKKMDCEICMHWAASQSNDFPCDECDGSTHYERPNPLLSDNKSMIDSTETRPAPSRIKSHSRRSFN